MSVADLVFRERRTGWAGALERTTKRRLALAFAASAALHFAFTSSFDWTEIFHADKAEGQPLRARIAPLAPVAAVEPAAVAKPAAPKARPKPAPKLPKAADAVLPPKPAPEPAPPVAAQAEPAAAEPPKPEPVAEAPKPEPPAAAPEPAGAGQPIAFPERIDLEFNLVQGNSGGPVGRVLHRFERQGERYTIRSTHELTGLGVLFNSGKYVQESQGAITAKGLRPERYSVQRGRAERNESASFDWGTAKATLVAGGSKREWDLKPGAQDFLSIIHQLSFMTGEEKLPSVWVTNGRRFYSVRVELVGKESVDLAELGQVATTHFRYQAGEDNLKVEVWLAPDYGYLPMKIRLRDRRGEEAEQVLANMKVR